MSILALKGKLRPTLKLKLGTKTAAFMAVLVIMTAAAVVVAGRFSLSNEFETQAREQVEMNLRTLALAYTETIKDAKVSLAGGKLARVDAAQMPTFNDHTIVDRTTSYVGGTATVFVYDAASNQFIRRTTNVKKENGDRAVGTQLAGDHPGQPFVRRGEAYKGPAVLFGQRYYTGYQPIMNSSGKPIGILYVGIPTAQYDAMLHHAIEMMAIAAALGVLGVIAITTFLAGRGVRPLVEVTKTMTALAAGDLDAKIGYTNRHDEIGAIARAVDVFKANAIERRQLEAEKQAAEGRVAAERKAEVQRFVREFQTAVGSIVETVSRSSKDFESVASTLARTAQTTQLLSDKAAGASEQASSHVQSAAAASEELSSSIVEISRQVQESNRIAAEAVEQAQATDQRIAELSEAGTRIGDVVKLITSIAEQTNLLALNATIEAARAGEAGRGFAVVAQEVKTLAGQTAKATEEISAHIGNMQTATADSVAAIKAIGSTIAKISEIATSIAAAVEEQGAATQDIARSVQSAANGTTEVATSIGEVAKGAGETGAATSQMAASAKTLSDESHRLETEVEKFLKTVAA